jgi:hypothetical protein
MDRIFLGEVDASVNLVRMAVLTVRVGRALGFRESEGFEGVRGVETGSRGRWRGQKRAC